MSEDKELEALLQALEDAESEQEETSKFTSKDNPQVERFIEELDIKAGVERVSTSVIFYTYRRIWKGQNDLTKLKKIEFFRQFKRHFTPTRTGKQRYYLLDPSSFNLSREGLLEAEHYNSKYNKEKRTRSERKKEKKRKEKRALGQSKKKQEPKA